LLKKEKLMDISVENVGLVAVIRFHGNLDTNSAPEGQQSLNKIIDDGGSKLLVNLAGVDFVSSAGLRILLVTAKRLGSAGGDMRISNLNEVVDEVFEMSGFSTILDVYETESQALDGF
jgi:anti-sigma B factor antagonist